MKLCVVVGTRPNFIKAAPLITAIRKLQKKKKDLEFFTLHNGQHFDENMSDIFFREMQIPKPQYMLSIESGSGHGKQTGEMLAKTEEVLMIERPDMVISIGDTNSTLAGALAAAKLLIPVAHVEAGLRMYNKGLAEDINRTLVDFMSTLLFPPSDSGTKNLLKEGFSKKQVFQYGDVMYDAILQFDKIADKQSKAMKTLDLKKKEFILATVHRAEHTGTIEQAKIILDAFVAISGQIKVVLPMHPRTKKLLVEHDLFDHYSSHIQIVDPLGYLDTIALEKQAKLIVTDSGGVQKEGFYQKTPVIFLFNVKTTWVELVEMGWMVEVQPKSTAQILKQIKKSLDSKPGKNGQPYGKGNAAELIIGKIVEYLEKEKKGAKK